MSQQEFKHTFDIFREMITIRAFRNSEYAISLEWEWIEAEQESIEITKPLLR